MSIVEEMKDLINKLNYYTELYDKGKPIISDEAWDNMYFELQKMENETGIIYPDSPTQTIHFEEVSELKKIKHNHPMLSLDKTKNIDDIKSFVNGYTWIAMSKLDGLTCSLKYVNGELISAETRGNGIEGEDITHNAKVITSIPKRIKYTKELIVDGEILCTYNDFEPFKLTYKNPRNFASGSIRLLDSKECAKRKLTFVAWDSFCDDDIYTSYLNYPYNIQITLSLKLQALEDLGFIVVPHICDIDILSVSNGVNDAIDFIKKEKSYPIDGVVFKYNDVEDYEAAGRTDHHFRGGLAYKFYDETYSTKLKYISWSMGRTGVLTPVAIFDPVDTGDSIIERASLHNVSIMRELLGDCAYVGEPLQVAKMNQIIPQVVEAGPKYNYSYVISHGGVSANDNIETCPICQGEVQYKKSVDGVINVYCGNPQCSGKLINILDHFAGKKGLDIKGLSKATFEKLIDWNWIEKIEDIFKLYQYRAIWIKKPGFGIASVDKILKSIEESKNTTLEKFISAIGIPLIGKTVSQILEKEFKTYDKFKEAVNNNKYNFSIIDGFGGEMNYAIKNFDYSEADNIAKLLNFKIENNQIIKKDILDGKIFTITGKLIHFKNRDEIKKLIISMGGKVSDTVSSKTTALINNDINSTSSKNKTAKNLGVPIISEEGFIQLYVEK